MNIIGLNAFHGDSSACLYVDGKLVAAAEEERFRRIKHWAGFPRESVKYCLEEGGLSLGQVDHVAINQDRSAAVGKKLTYLVTHVPSPSLVWDRLKNRRARISLADHFAEIDEGFRAEVHAVEHHRAHMASAFMPSPFDEAVVVSVDGFGDFSSAAWGLGGGDRIEVSGRVHFPHSLGIFYQAMTQYLGFPNYGDEYKVMGLAPYGEPRWLDAMRDMVILEDNGGFRLNLKYFRHHREKIGFTWEGGSPVFANLFSPALERLLGPGRKHDEPLSDYHRDLARSVQARYEEAFFHLLNRLHETYRVENLALAGGCAMNSVANGKVFRNTPFERLYVQAAAGDAGGAIGAAASLWHDLAPDRISSAMKHGYWGPSYSNDDVKKVLDAHVSELSGGEFLVEKVNDESDLVRMTLDCIESGGVVGWFQGRMEWGPRALGNRSILGDPRRADMKDILNLKIKRRESFRPFAPSIVREAVTDWFEEDDEVPFMMQVHQIRADRRHSIPAVTHVDGSGRLQTVSQKQNPRYYRLIKAFGERTGVPILLNTSFNENEPIVCRPEEAFDCFLRTSMDLLVMEDWVVRRRSTVKVAEQ